MKRLLVLLLLLFATQAAAQDIRPSAYQGQPGKVTVRGGKIMGSTGGVVTIAEQTITPANSATTYIYIDLSTTPAVTTSTSGFPSSSYFPIATAVKDANGIMSLTDSRPDFFMAGGSSFSNPANGGAIVGGYFDAAAAPYNLKSGFIAVDCAAVSGSPNVTCTNTTFTSAMIGWLAHGSNAAGGVGAFTSAVFTFPLLATLENTIIGCSPSCPSKTAILSSNASSTVASPSFVLTVGPDMTTPLLSIITDAWNTPTTRPDCGLIKLPAGVFLFKRAIGINPTCKMALQASNEKNAEVEGWGATATLLAPTQDFDYTTCNGAANACIFDIGSGSRLRHFGIWGGGGQAFGTITNKFALASYVDTTYADVTCIGWNGGKAGFFGLSGTATGAQPIVLMQLDGCGDVGMVVQASQSFYMESSFVGDDLHECVRTQGGATSGFFSTNNGFLGCNAGGDQVVVNGMFVSTGDNHGQIGVKSGGEARITALFSNASGGGGTNAINVAAGGKATVTGSDLTSIPTAALSVAGTGILISGGGNKINGISLGATTATVVLSPTDIITGTITTLLPTCTVTGAGATATCAVDTGSTVERGTLLVTAAGAGPAALGTFTLTFNQTYVLNGQPPSCLWTLDNGGNTAWNPRATVIKGAQATTSSVANWDNNAAALVAANTVKAGWTCSAR